MRHMSEDTISEDAASQAGAPEYGISKDKSAAAKRRMRRFRKYNIRMLILSVFILIALCGSLLVRIRSLNQEVSDLSAQLEKLVRITTRQQEVLEQLTEASRTAMGNSAVVGNKEEDGKDKEGEDPGTGENGLPEITAAHKVYLTFDDGPGANTQDILDILEEYDVKATFFVVGDAGEKAEEEMRKIVEAGHTIGMHSYSHKYSELYASVENFAKDLKKQQDYIYEVTGVKSTVYRFPGGSSNTVSEIDMKEFAKYLDSQGIRFFDWNISSGDGGGYLFPKETIIENCVSNVSKYSTSVILMHDVAGKTTTREALPVIIEKILEMDDTVILPITDETTPVQHIKWQDET